MSTRLEIEIEELGIDGCDPADGREIGGAFQRELHRLFERHVATGGVVGPQSFAAIDAGRIEVPSGAGPREIGMEAARAVFGAVTR